MFLGGIQSAFGNDNDKRRGANFENICVRLSTAKRCVHHIFFQLYICITRSKTYIQIKA